MASNGGPPDAFGYMFTHGDPYSPDNVPPAGPPLLEGLESNLFESFWDNPSDPLASAAALLPLQSKNDPSQDYNWLFDVPPPTLHGVSAAVTGPAESSHTYPAVNHGAGTGFVDPGGTGTANSTSEGVFGAASTLFNNFNGVQDHTMHNDSIYLGQGAVMSSLRGYRHHQNADDFQSTHSAPYHRPTITAPPAADNAAASVHMLPLGYIQPDHVPHPLESTPPSRTQTSRNNQPKSSPPINPRLYHFGSDEHFANHGFIPPPHIDTEAAATSRLMYEVSTALKLQSSANSSMPTSPVVQRRSSIRQPAAERPSPHETSDSEDEAESKSQARKRRKGKQTRTDASADSITPTKAKPTNRKSTSTTTARSTKARRVSQTSTTPGKRRKSSPATGTGSGSGSKAPRENLSEEQKRENHIHSEQKRRNLIKVGFEELHRLVPELRAGGYSKSQVLVEAASFLESLVEGNRRLRERLEGLEGLEGG